MRGCCRVAPCSLHRAHGVGDCATVPAVAQTFVPLLLLPTAVSVYVASKVFADRPGRQRHGVGGQMVKAVQQLTANVGEEGGQGA